MDIYDDKGRSCVELFQIKTSCEIIKEAKEAIRYRPTMNTKIVKTKRPFTPLETHRILFGSKKCERPPSSVSFQNIQFEEIESKSSIKPSVTYINQNESSNLLTPNYSKVKLPSINHQSTSSLNNKGELQQEKTVDEREIHSSPSLGQYELDQKTEFPCVKSSQKLLPSLFQNGITVRPRKVTKAWSEIDSKAEKSNSKDYKLPVTNNSVQNVLSLICKAISDGYEDDEMISFVEKLYNAMEKEELTKPNNQNRLIKNLILKTIFGLVDSPNDLLVAHSTQVILALRVTRSNLTTMCKIVFRISRSDKNDYLFQQQSIIASFVDCLGLANPEEDAEALIYGYGALKFLTMNLQLLKQTLDYGILQLMALHLKLINTAKSEGSYLSEQTNHVLFQLTGCLRNVASNEDTHNNFSTSGMLSEVCQTLQLFHTDADLVLNIARIISVLSTNQSCCEIISAFSNLKLLVRILDKYSRREDIVIRLAYGIGNVLACCENSRFELYEYVGYILQVVCNLVNIYLEIDSNESLELNKRDPKCHRRDDVLVKVIRVVANMSIEPKVGVNLVCFTNDNDEKKSIHPEKVGQFLDMLIIILRSKTVHENEELVLSTLSTLNNLSYYSHPQIKGPFQERYLDLSEALNIFLQTNHIDLMIEIARVYGNLTHSTIITKYILETGGFSYIISWLDSSNRELLCTATGVLVNMMVDRNARQIFKHTNCIIKLIKILGKYAENDWQLATLVCQVIWNYNIDANDKFFSLESEDGQKLLHVLIDLLDEDRLFGENKNIFDNMNYKLWEDFSIVATNILENTEAS